MNMKKKLSIETWGCQMNVADSESMATGLEKEYHLISNANEADLIVLNTCHIREKARHKVVSRLGVLAEQKMKNKNLIVVVAGCVAQAEGKKLLAQNQTIDILLGPGRLEELPRLLSDFKETRKQSLAVGFPKLNQKKEVQSLESNNQTTVRSNAPLNGKNEVSRFVTIQQGCNNYCTFCVVPFTRGREISLSPHSIIEQSKAFIRRGAKEITLLGQNVNSYGLDLTPDGSLEESEETPFVRLLRQVSEIDGLQSLRFTTSNPHDFTFPLAKLFGEKKVLGKYLHLPVQSGSDQVLLAMKRKVTVAQFKQRITWLKEFVPDIAVSTDIIVGFPGETEEDFEATMELVRWTRFSFAFAFKYSQRKNTPATRFKDQIPEEVKSARLNRLNALLNEITIEENKKSLGLTMTVLFLYKSKKEENIYYGRNEHFRLIRVFSSSCLVGQKVSVKVESCSKIALNAKLLF